MRRGPAIVLGVLAFGGLLAVLGPAIRPEDRPTVVLVSIDTLRTDRLGAYGRSPSITPRMDGLAARAVVFDTVWTTAPLTVPAHASLLTGLTPPLHGLRTNHPPGRLPDAADSVAEVFRAGGWATAAFVSASVLRADRTGLDAGFDLYDDVAAPSVGVLHDTERKGMDTVDAALAWIRRTQGPQFVWIHLFDPHAPYAAPAPHGPGPGHEADATGYDAEVAYTDACVGRLLDGLVAAGLEDAVVALTADHGEGLGEHGESTHGYLLHEATLRVPLFISAPGRLSSGIRRDEPASVVDVAPTLVALAGLPVPERMAGRALPARDEPSVERWLYAESLYGHEVCRWAQVFAMRAGTTKYVDAGPETLVFDLAADPGESTPVRLPALPVDGSAEASHEAHRLVSDLLRVQAALEPVGQLGAGATGAVPGYFSPVAGPASAVLPRTDNALLPDPHGRMGALDRFEAGLALLSRGRAAEALGEFDAAVAADPDNPQFHRFRGRGLKALGRHEQAADAFLRAFDLGWRHPDAVARILQASVAAFRPGREDLLQGALGLAERARGMGIPQDAWGLIFEATVHLYLGRKADARACLDRAREHPLDERSRRAADQLGQALSGSADPVPDGPR